MWMSKEVSQQDPGDDFITGELYQDTPNLPKEDMPGSLFIPTEVAHSDLRPSNSEDIESQTFSTELMAGVEKHLTKKPGIKDHIISRAKEHPIAVTAGVGGITILMGLGAVEAKRGLKDMKRFVRLLENHGPNKQ